ncbi:uncharacterized protein LOC134228569 isoform X2 [Saccostrea cucullata]|uniref:uncharacterized protein LOC134228569 isoform X2 n=1 Tax=Saccostrea cuccullata TaxID=36930 RepID=UPI002ED5BF7E
MIFKLLCYFHLATCLGSNDRSIIAHHITKPIITRGCHNISLESHSILRKDCLEENNVTNCYQFCFLNQSGSTVKALLLKGTECVCSFETLHTSFDTAKRCNESCPGNSNQSCGGYGHHTYAVYEIENITSNDQNAGCGFVKFQLYETNPTLKSGDCNLRKMAYCTMLNNVDGTVIKTTNMTWDEHNNNCSGHLAFIGDTKTVQWKLDNAIQSGFTFWVGHRIWNYVPIEFDEADSSNNHDDTESEIFIDEINESSGDTADSSNDHDGTKRVVLRDEINKSDDVPSSITLIIAVTVPVVVLIVILLAVVCMKRKKAKLNSSKQHKNVSSKNAPHEGHDVPLQPARSQTQQDQDYDHLHGNPASLHSDNVYDVSGQCTDGPSIQDSMYNTSKQCSGNELYDSSVCNPQKSESENIMNSDMYSTMNMHDGGEYPKDIDLYDHTSSSGQNNDKTDIYNEIDT